MEKPSREYLRPVFGRVWAKIEKERGYPCKKTFEDLCNDADAGQDKALEFLERLHVEGRAYSFAHRHSNPMRKPKP